MKKLILSSVASIFLASCNDSMSEKAQAEIQTTTAVKTGHVVPNFQSQKANVTVDEAFELTKKGALLIDVREPLELAEIAYDVKNIKNIPLGELESRLTEVPKDKQVIVACKSGRRSSKAYELLKAKGFKNISNMEGGMDAWKQKGLPVIKGKK